MHLLYPFKFVLLTLLLSSEGLALRPLIVWLFPALGLTFVITIFLVALLNS